jgi:tripartite-type tricarboxylate transporter receptor subunit TctC
MKKQFVAALLAAFVLSAAAWSAEFPVKQISLVCPVAPGGASDMTSRIFASQMEKILGTPVIVSNRPGASNAIGMEYVKNRRPDGYTMGYIPVEVAMLRSLGMTDLASSDFTYIARVMTIPAALTVRKDAPWNTFDEFIAYAKANPEKIQIGNSGTGSIWHIAAAAMEGRTGTKYVHVPFDGAALAVTALMGGNVDAITVSPPEVKTAVESGEFKVLAVFSDVRSSVFPDVPTAKELGTEILTLAWGAFALPKDVPADILAIIEQAAKEAAASEEMKKFFADRGFEHAYLDAAGMEAFAKQQQAFYDELIPRLGLAK